MANGDGHEQSQRLAARYALLEDAELLKIAADGPRLTETARQVLQAELSRRGIEFTIMGPVAAAVVPRLPPPVIVARYRDLPFADVAISILESAEVECVLIDENVVRLDWLWSNLVGNVKALVRADDVEVALALLTQPIPEAFVIDNGELFRQPRCPRCNSLDVIRDAPDKRFYAGLLIGLPIPVTIKGWRCYACGHEWPDETGTGSPPDGEAKGEDT